jgi:radical SAM superfamily enzyme YgiQ (UPF0313 family)
MKILLVWTMVDNSYDCVEFHFGVASLAASLKAAGHDVHVFMPHRRARSEEHAAAIAQLGADLVGFSCMTNEWPHDREVIARLKELTPEVSVLVGGYHPSLAPEEVIAHPAVDYVIRGEGELVLGEMVRRLVAHQPLDDLSGLWLKRDGRVIRNPMGPFVADLDRLPEVYREDHHVDLVLKTRGGALPVMAGRGCPLACTYCCNVSMAALYGDRRFAGRLRSVGRFVGELEGLARRFSRLKSFESYDETFTLNHRWLRDFLEVYGRRLGLPMDVMTRADTVNRELLELMRRAGVSRLRFGLEHGDEEFRRGVLGRKMKTEDMVEVFRIAEDLGFETFAYLMVGLPHETPALAQRTVDLIARLRVSKAQISVFHPYPMTKLHDEAVARGWYAGTSASSYFGGSVLQMPDFPPEQIARYHAELLRVVEENAVRAHRFGDADLLLLLPQAEVTAPPGFVGHARFFLGHPLGRPTPWLQAHPPARIRYRVAIERDSFLNVTLGMHPNQYGQPGGGVRYTVLADDRPVFTETIRPKTESAHRGWKDVGIPLGSAAGPDRILELRTDAEPAEAGQYCLATWGRAHLARAPWAPPPDVAVFAMGGLDYDDFVAPPANREAV